MPPASRGALLAIRKPVSCSRSSARCYASLQKPRNPRSFPTQARARPRAAPDSPPTQPAPTPEASQPAQPERPSRLRLLLLPFHIVRQWLRSHPYIRTSFFSFLVTVPISGLLLMHFPFEPRRVTGPSMRPTINSDCESDNDTSYSPTWVLVQKWSPNDWRQEANEINKARRSGQVDPDTKSVKFKYSRGDLIVYRTPHDPEKVALKRVVGLPGDSVVPLKGYDGGEEQEPVVVPYNHLWVEGDVNDRKKSIDSNYFGPISQALVKGKVTAIWSPWWNIFGMRTPDYGKHIWPAKQQGRVLEGAVESATVNPDVIAFVKGFEDEQGLKTLKTIREQPGMIRRQWGDAHVRKQIQDFWGRALIVAEMHQDPATRRRAMEIVEEMERITGKQYLYRGDPAAKRERWKPADPVQHLTGEEAKKVSEYFTDVNTHEDEQVAWRETYTAPAQAALKQMIKQKKKLSEMYDKEMEERDKVLEAKES